MRVDTLGKSSRHGFLVEELKVLKALKVPPKA